MHNEQLLEKYGVFEAKVPRFTSYPPANIFAPGTGQRHQSDWLARVAPDEAISLYVHIPFCRRLCWFCACRTQGTQTLRPVSDYVTALRAELSAVRAHLAPGVRLARLHFGGGTPTILSAPLMDALAETIFRLFPTHPSFEFSVEIDPTDAPTSVLDTLAGWGLHRASIGVQDFAPEVQAAIGRPQSFAQTVRVIDRLTAFGVTGINLDLLYGLPQQSASSLKNTLTKVLSLAPDRLALYGYAHVPHVSKRQVMIDAASLPPPKERYHLSRIAAARLVAEGYTAIGIDHFARPGDPLAKAARQRRLRRNFQGYTDDPCETLIGIGASAISRFRAGYVQNAVATAAYSARIAATGLAGHRGHCMSPEDTLIAAMIEQVMCRHRIDLAEIRRLCPSSGTQAEKITAHLQATFPDALAWDDIGIAIRPAARGLTRIIAAAIGQQSHAGTGSAAI